MTEASPQGWLATSWFMVLAEKILGYVTDIRESKNVKILTKYIIMEYTLCEISVLLLAG